MQKDKSPDTIKITSFPLFISVVILLLNDLVLKRADILPGVISGKISDFAFLFFLPIFLCFLFRARSPFRSIAVYVFTALFFSIINLSAAVSIFLENTVSAVFPIRLWQDPSDLVALFVLPLSYFYLKSSLLGKPNRGIFLNTH